MNKFKRAVFLGCALPVSWVILVSASFVLLVNKGQETFLISRWVQKISFFLSFLIFVGKSLFEKLGIVPNIYHSVFLFLIQFIFWWIVGVVIFYLFKKTEVNKEAQVD